MGTMVQASGGGGNKLNIVETNLENLSYFLEYNGNGGPLTWQNDVTDIATTSGNKNGFMVAAYAKYGSSTSTQHQIKVLDFNEDGTLRAETTQSNTGTSINVNVNSLLQTRRHKSGQYISIVNCTYSSPTITLTYKVGTQLYNSMTEKTVSFDLQNTITSIYFGGSGYTDRLKTWLFLVDDYLFLWCNYRSNNNYYAELVCLNYDSSTMSLSFNKMVYDRNMGTTFTDDRQCWIYNYGKIFRYNNFVIIPTYVGGTDTSVTANILNIDLDTLTAYHSFGATNHPIIMMNGVIHYKNNMYSIYKKIAPYQQSNAIYISKRYPEKGVEQSSVTANTGQGLFDYVLVKFKITGSTKETIGVNIDETDSIIIDFPIAQGVPIRKRTYYCYPYMDNKKFVLSTITFPSDITNYEQSLNYGAFVIVENPRLIKPIATT